MRYANKTVRQEVGKKGLILQLKECMVQKFNELSEVDEHSMVE